MIPSSWELFFGLQSRHGHRCLMVLPWQLTSVSISASLVPNINRKASGSTAMAQLPLRQVTLGTLGPGFRESAWFDQRKWAARESLIQSQPLSRRMAACWWQRLRSKQPRLWNDSVIGPFQTLQHKLYIYNHHGANIILRLDNLHRKKLSFKLKLQIFYISTSNSTCK